MPEPMTPEQLHILQHALGVDEYGRGNIYRSHYVGGEDECRQLVAMGYMTEFPASVLSGGSPWFRVTDAGKRAVREQSPKPPKLTRGQQRYRDYLRVADLISFGDWLKAKKRDSQGVEI